MMKKVAVIGMGFIGFAHIEALRRLPDVEIIAICTRNQEKAEKVAAEQNIPNWFTDYNKMMDEIDLDAVHIATPNNIHFDISMAAMKRNINVLCEKPFTTTVEEALELTAFAKERNLQCGLNYHNRFYPMPNQMKRMIASGLTGDVIAVTGEYTHAWMLNKEDFNWRCLRQYSGKTRIVCDTGSHWIDLAQFVTGHKIVSVFSEFNCVYPKRILNSKEIKIDTEDMAAMLFKFDNGALGNAFVTGMQAGRRNRTLLTVAGKKSAITWDNEDINNLEIGHHDGSNEIFMKDPRFMSEHSAKLSSYPAGHAEGFPDAFKNLFIDFYHSIDKPDGKYDYATFEDAVYEMKILDAIFESQKARKWININ